MDTGQLAIQTNDIVTRASSIVVASDDDYAMAGRFGTELATVAKTVHAVLDPFVASAHEAHKRAVAERAQYLDKLDMANRTVKQKMGTYHAEQQRRREADERAAREAVRRQEEERRLAEAAALEAAGRKSEADARIEAPIVVPEIALPPATPKVQGVQMRTTWGFEIVDESSIPREYLTPDRVKIGAVVRAMGKQTQIPGVRPVPRTSPTFNTK